MKCELNTVDFRDEALQSQALGAELTVWSFYIGTYIPLYSGAFFETRFQKSGPLWFSVTLDTLKDLKMLLIIMHYEIIMDFDAFIHSNCLIGPSGPSFLR